MVSLLQWWMSEKWQACLEVVMLLNWETKMQQHIRSSLQRLPAHDRSEEAVTRIRKGQDRNMSNTMLGTLTLKCVLHSSFFQYRPDMGTAGECRFWDWGKKNQTFLMQMLKKIPAVFAHWWIRSQGWFGQQSALSGSRALAKSAHKRRSAHKAVGSNGFEAQAGVLFLNKNSEFLREERKKASRVSYHSGWDKGIG